MAWCEHVEVLAAEHLGAHRVATAAPARASGVRRQAGAAQHVVGPDQGEVAEQDRGGRAEPGGPAAPARRRRAGGRTRRARSGGRAGCAEASMRSSCTSAHAWISSSAPIGAQHRGGLGRVRVAARAAPAPPGERGPDALAAAQHERRTARRRRRRRRGRSPRRPRGARPGRRRGPPRCRSGSATVGGIGPPAPAERRRYGSVGEGAGGAARPRAERSRGPGPRRVDAAQRTTL